MSAILMDGKAVAADVKRAVKEKCLSMENPPTLGVVLVGDNPASAVYVRNKEKDCAECGIRCVDHRLPEDTTEEQLLALVAELNARSDVDGILVQLPLPKQIRERVILEAIDPRKDVTPSIPSTWGGSCSSRPNICPAHPPASWSF